MQGLRGGNVENLKFLALTPGYMVVLPAEKEKKIEGNTRIILRHEKLKKLKMLGEMLNLGEKSEGTYNLGQQQQHKWESWLFHSLAV